MLFTKRRNEMIPAERVQMLQESLYQKAKQESQRKSSLYGQQAFEQLVNKYKLIDPTKFSTVH